MLFYCRVLFSLCCKTALISPGDGRRRAAAAHLPHSPSDVCLCLFVLLKTTDRRQIRYYFCHQLLVDFRCSAIKTNGVALTA